MSRVITYHENNQIKQEYWTGNYNSLILKEMIAKEQTLFLPPEIWDIIFKYLNGNTHMKQGEYKAYDKEGNICVKQHYKDDHLHGEHISYVNGKIYNRIHYQNGMIHGQYEIYSNEKLKSSYMYANDRRHGIHVSMHHTGVIKSRCNYVNDKIEGEEIHYTSNGEIERVITYINGFEQY
jgi:antitoxin component YwqK of YwqJK toxin-antitoxin module